MRFSVTIAVTLAAIAGSVIATSGPLYYARALEQVNPFEPDEVDIYSRNNHGHFHQLAAEKLESAINPTKSAIVFSQCAIDHGPPHEQERWMDQKKFHETTLHGLEKLRDAHGIAAMQPGITPLFHMVRDTWEHAGDVAEHAKGVCLEAQQVVKDTAVANKALATAMHTTRRAIGHTQRNIDRMAQDNQTIWTDRHAELQAMHSRLEEMHKAHKEGSLNSMDVPAQAAVIAHQAKSLGEKARNSFNSSNHRENPRVSRLI